MALFDLPAELQLAVARRLSVIDRLALGSTCRSAAPLVVHTALLKFRLSGRAASEFAQAGAFIRGDHSSSTTCDSCVGVDNMRLGSAAVCAADSADRTKGHLLPLYEAVDPGGIQGRICAENDDVAGDGSAWPWPAFTNWGTQILTGAHDSPSLPVGLAPQHVSLGLSDAWLAMLAGGTAAAAAAAGAAAGAAAAADGAQGPPPHLPKRVSLRSSLIVLDLSRAHNVASVGACGLAKLREASLPPAVRLAHFDRLGLGLGLGLGSRLPLPLPLTLPLTLTLTLTLTSCAQLRRLRLGPDGCAALLSLRLGGCRLLEAAGFLGAEGAVPLRPDNLAELDLSWFWLGLG